MIHFKVVLKMLIILFFSLPTSADVGNVGKCRALETSIVNIITGVYETCDKLALLETYLPYLSDADQVFVKNYLETTKRFLQKKYNITFKINSLQENIKYNYYFTCADGWQSYSIGKKGACSRHGGVVMITKCVYNCDNIDKVIQLKEDLKGLHINEDFSAISSDSVGSLEVIYVDEKIKDVKILTCLTKQQHLFRVVHGTSWWFVTGAYSDREYLNGRLKYKLGFDEDFETKCLGYQPYQN